MHYDRVPIKTEKCYRDSLAIDIHTKYNYDIKLVSSLNNFIFKKNINCVSMLRPFRFRFVPKQVFRHTIYLKIVLKNK